jgi:hypothetical protein
MSADEKIDLARCARLIIVATKPARLKEQMDANPYEKHSGDAAL